MAADGSPNFRTASRMEPMSVFGDEVLMLKARRQRRGRESKYQL